MQLTVNTQLINMDVLIAERVIKNNDDSYTVLLNSRLSHERLMEAYSHALQHIQDDDFEKETADKIEFDAHSA